MMNRELKTVNSRERVFIRIQVPRLLQYSGYGVYVLRQTLILISQLDGQQPLGYLGP